MWPSWARQWYEPASLLVAAGSRRLLLGPSRSRAPFRYQEKRMAGVGLRPLLQLSVTACPSTTSAAGLMRRRAAGRRGRKKGSAPRTFVAPCYPPPASHSSYTIVGKSGFYALNSNSDLLIVGRYSTIEENFELEPGLCQKPGLIDKLCLPRPQNKRRAAHAPRVGRPYSSVVPPASDSQHRACSKCLINKKQMNA